MTEFAFGVMCCILVVRNAVRFIYTLML